jgi:23S rRNA (guanine745-N1)-methyltransferase
LTNPHQLYDPSTHPDWIAPHSLAWYAQLGSAGGRYAYTWESTLPTPNGETIFEDELAALVPGKAVLDVGCGHGELTLRWADLASKIVGFDVIDDFLATGKSLTSQVEFVAGNVKTQGLPFADDSFDMAYTRRGPASFYRQEANRVVRPGGVILGLHPADSYWQEVHELFPGLYAPAAAGTPVLDSLHAYLDVSSLANITIETLVTTEYLHSPADLIRNRCFGQKASVLETVTDRCLPAVTEIFERHAAAEGLPLTHARYLVRANAHE